MLRGCGGRCKRERERERENHPQIVNLPLRNEHVNIKDNTTGEVTKTEKLIIQIPTRELNNDLIKPPSEGGFSGSISESGELIIGDTLLIKYIPPQFLK